MNDTSKQLFGGANMKVGVPTESHGFRHMGGGPLHPARG